MQAQAQTSPFTFLKLIISLLTCYEKDKFEFPVFDVHIVL